MTKHTVRSYDKDFNILRDGIIEMLNLVKDVILVAKKSLNEKNDELVNIADEIDAKINILDIEIEEKAISIIALRQPMAIDLREAIASLKMAVILERIGDLAKHIPHRVSHFVEIDNDDNKAKIEEMFSLNIFMIENLIESYKFMDTNIAYSVFQTDEEVDKIYAALMSSLESEIELNSKQSRNNLKMIYVTKNLERICDYLAKLASLVNYIITGSRNISKLNKG